MEQGCKHCLYYALCPKAILNKKCENFKYDPPDGGYYG